MNFRKERAVRIWVVDDDPAICSMLQILLSNKGHQVETYADPTATPITLQQGTVCCHPHPCADAMLVDYFMPNMNGLEFLRLLEVRGCRAIKGNRAIITAYGTSELCQELEQLGVKYFRKPFRFPEIDKWLNDCADRLETGAGTPHPAN